jgi:uncharacterized membrane protein YgcG
MNKVLEKIKVLMIIISIVLCSGKQYMPEDLVKMKPYNGYINLYDPDNYLKNELIQDMINLTNNIKNVKNYEVFIYVIYSMNNKFGYDMEKDISWFTNDLSYLKLKSDSQRDENTIFILISIDDRQSHLRTGGNVKSYLQDAKCSEYLQSINNNLRNGEYDSALLSLLQKIESRLMTKYQWLSDLADWLYNLFIKLLILSVLVIICLVFSFLFQKKLKKSAEDQLKKIKNITQNGKPRRDFIEKVCVICLEELEEDKKENGQDQVHTNLNNQLNSQAPQIEIQNEERHNIEQEKFFNKKEDNFIAKLECGHSFHSKCISQWMEKNNQCPVCREKIDKEEEPSHDEKAQNQTSNSNRTTNTSTTLALELFTRSLINIQTSIHPELSSLDYSYGSNFSWRFPQSSSSSSRSSYSSSWGSGRGGASSKW